MSMATGYAIQTLAGLITIALMTLNIWGGEPLWLVLVNSAGMFACIWSISSINREHKERRRQKVRAAVIETFD